jgi:two-component system chemotaxis response regulator CheY
VIPVPGPRKATFLGFKRLLNGAAALEKLRSGERFDVLIFDNDLPDASGIELIKQTRALAHRQQIQIIMLPGDDVEPHARRASANAFLRKPEDVPLIAEMIARLLARKARQN